METNREASQRLRVLVVDDSALYRKVVSDLLAEIPEVEVVGVAANGKIALERIEQHAPDLLTLDIEMPELDGLGVLREIEQRGLHVGAIVLSALSTQGAMTTNSALKAGAFDFALKPTASGAEESKAELRSELLPKIRAYWESLNSRKTCATHLTTKLSSACSANHLPGAETWKRSTSPRRPRIIAIGISTGGPAALAKLIPSLPGDLPVPIVIVQHMPPVFTKSLADELNKTSELTVREAQDGDLLLPGTVTIAPGGKQIKVEKIAAGGRVLVTDDPPERNCRPSVDYLFRSVAESYGGHCLAMILTGMGDDGLLGCQLLKQRGATIIAQDECSSVVYGMPRQIVENGLADVVCSLDGMPTHVMEIVRPEASLCR